MGLKEANLTTHLDQSDRLLWWRSHRCLALQLWFILDCSVQQSMEGSAASSSYRHSTKGMEWELAAAERITGTSNRQQLQCSLSFSFFLLLSLSLSGKERFSEPLSFFEMTLILLVDLWCKSSLNKLFSKYDKAHSGVCAWMWESVCEENICNYANNGKIKPWALVYYIFNRNLNL